MRTERQQKARQQVKDLLALERVLQIREYHFLDDMADQEEALSPDQMKKIDEIYEKRR